MNEVREINVVTHSGTFHADEVFAYSLIRVVEKLKGNKVNEPIRMRHQTDVNELIRLQGELGYIIDIGKVECKECKHFDHHQYSKDECRYSSAGMVLEYFKEELGGAYATLRPIVDKIDENDIGVKPSEEWELSRIIGCYNGADVYNDVEQLDNFMDASDVCVVIIRDHIHRWVMRMEAVDKLKRATDVDGMLVSADGYIKGWSEVIHDINELDGYDVIIWYDDGKDTWNAQTIPDKKGSYGKRGRSIRCSDELPDGIEFVHKGEFFMVAKTYDDLMSYLNKNLYK